MMKREWSPESWSAASPGCLIGRKTCESCSVRLQLVEQGPFRSKRGCGGVPTEKPSEKKGGGEGMGAREGCTENHEFLLHESVRILTQHFCLGLASATVANQW